MTVLEGTWTKRLTNRPGITREPRFGEFGSQIFLALEEVFRVAFWEPVVGQTGLLGL